MSCKNIIMVALLSLTCVTFAQANEAQKHIDTYSQVVYLTYKDSYDTAVAFPGRPRSPH